MSKISKATKDLRKAFAFKLEPTCPNCGKPGNHFCPPSLGDLGFYACDEINKLSPFLELPTDN